MTFERKPRTVVGLLLLSALALGACGDDASEDAEPGEETGGSGGDSATGGAPGKGGSATGGKSAGTGGNTTAPSDCDPPSAPVEHCYAENADREGTATCSEYYQAGLAMLFCTAPEAGGCPRTGELSGACIGGLTSSYYYADGSNEGFWVAAEPGCEVNGGAWCSL